MGRSLSRLERLGRSLSRLERPDWRRRGGGGGGAIVCVVLGSETDRGLRLEFMDVVRLRPEEPGEIGGDMKVEWREGGGVADTPGKRRDVAVEGSSVVEESGVDIVLAACPCRRAGGGGGGDLRECG